MKYERFENDTYDLYTIETSKFKSGHLEVVFRSEATKENMTYIALLMSILFENSKKYPSKKLLAKRLADLYNASINATSTRIGNTIITNAMIDFIDPVYTDMNTLEESIELIFDMLLHPNADEFEFDEQTFERMKRDLAIEIEAIKEDPKGASILEAIAELCPEDPRSWSAQGDIETLSNITPKKLYDFYRRFLETSPRDIYLIGNLDMKKMNKIIRKYAAFSSIATTDAEVYLPNIPVNKTRTVAVNKKVTQTNLVQLYTFANLTERERDYVVPLFNMIWGSGSLESKLYKSLRAEHSLCYNVNTYYQKYDRFIVLHTAVADENVSLALKLIANSTASMRKGSIEEKELLDVVNLLETSLHMSLDNPNRLIDMYVFKNLIGLPDIEERIDEIKTVKLKEIVGVAKKMKLALTYKARGE